MLVITRKPNESFIINDNIEVKIVEISKDRVRIGIEAPKDIKIMRKEIIVTQEFNKQASEGLSNEAIKELLKNK